MEKLVSIIIPVYGVERFVGKCMQSLLSQSYDRIEYLVIDDCSQDDSISIIKNIVEKYPNRKNAVQILTHEENKGLSAARNTGLLHAKGDYVYHCDSDDWVDPTMLADLVNILEINDADISYCDFYLSFNHNERYMAQPTMSNSQSCISAMLSGKMKFNVWNKLIKRDLYINNGVFFPEGRNMGEDMTMFKLFCHAKTIVHVPKGYYHYTQINPDAFTKTMSSKQMADMKWNIDKVISYIEENKGSICYKDEIDYFKLNMKLPFLISLDKNLYNAWRTWFPEANHAIWKNKEFSFRVRCVQYAALHKHDWFVRLYNLIIVRFIYGVVYR